MLVRRPSRPIDPAIGIHACSEFGDLIEEAVVGRSLGAAFDTWPATTAPPRHSVIAGPVHHHAAGPTRRFIGTRGQLTMSARHERSGDPPPTGKRFRPCAAGNGSRIEVCALFCNPSMLSNHRLRCVQPQRTHPDDRRSGNSFGTTRLLRPPSCGTTLIRARARPRPVSCDRNGRRKPEFVLRALLVQYRMVSSATIRGAHVESPPSTISFAGEAMPRTAALSTRDAIAGTVLLSHQCSRSRPAWPLA